MATLIPSQPRSININSLKNHILQVISRELESNPRDEGDRKTVVLQLIQQAFTDLKYNFPKTIKDQVTREILDELLGFGPLQPFLDDPEISEVMVNGPEKIYIEKKGRLHKTNVSFPDDTAVLRIIDKIIMPLGRRIDADGRVTVSLLRSIVRIGAPSRREGSTDRGRLRHRH